MTGPTSAWQTSEHPSRCDFGRQRHEHHRCSRLMPWRTCDQLYLDPNPFSCEPARGFEHAGNRFMVCNIARQAQHSIMPRGNQQNRKLLVGRVQAAAFFYPDLPPFVDKGVPCLDLDMASSRPAASSALSPSTPSASSSPPDPSLSEYP